MRKNDKAPVAPGACQCAELDPSFEHQSTISQLGPQPPRMGTALTYLLHRFLRDLRAYDHALGDRITRQMIDSGEFLLIEGQRLEGGNDE